MHHLGVSRRENARARFLFDIRMKQGRDIVAAGSIAPIADHANANST